MFFHGVKDATLNKLHETLSKMHTTLDKVHVTLSKVHTTLTTLSRMRYISVIRSIVGIWCVTYAP
jgi:hypothetical protein